MGFRFINKRRNRLLSDSPRDDHYYIKIHASNGKTFEAFKIPRDEIVKFAGREGTIYGAVKSVDIFRYAEDINSLKKIGRLEAVA